MTGSERERVARLLQEHLDQAELGRRLFFDPILSGDRTRACATCHVYVDEAWREATGKPSAMEESMLDFAEEVEPNSRLSCQIRVSDDLDGLIVRLPQSQH